MKSKIIVLVMTAFMFCSCNSWLDIKPKLEIDREDVFGSENGFNDVLSGCYAMLKDETLYGKNLTMIHLEFMAQHWVMDDVSKPFRSFNYADEQVKAIFSNAYTNMYKVIAQANDMIFYLDKQGMDVIQDQKTVDRLKGEALAIRAFCQFDLLRIFGQVPTAGATTKVSLPYAERASEERIPSYDYDTYVSMLDRDFMAAEDLLKESDPVTQYTFAELNDPVTLGEKDSNNAFRRLKFNYWAVKGLRARFYLYTGKKSDAYRCANDVITAQVHGEKPLALSVIGDMANKAYTLPSETLMAIHVYDLAKKVETLFDGRDAMSAAAKKQAVTADIFLNETSDARLQLFDEQVMAGSGDTKRVTIKKYWQNAEGLGLGNNKSVSASDNYVTMQMVPLIRLAECYLIASEAAPNLQESNRLMLEYKASRNIEHRNYSSLATRETDIMNQYQREFWGEGQMIFTYKRKMSPSMQWGTIMLEEKNYIVPLPDGEF